MIAARRSHIKRIKLALLLVGLAVLLTGMHNIDNAWNAKIVNVASKMTLEVGFCQLEFPALWEEDMLPDGGVMKAVELYLLGVRMCILGVILFITGALL